MPLSDDDLQRSGREEMAEIREIQRQADLSPLGLLLAVGALGAVCVLLVGLAALWAAVRAGLGW